MKRRTTDTVTYCLGSSITACDFCGSGCAPSFPKDEKLCRQWCQAQRREHFTPMPGVTLLCSEYFLNSDFDSTGQTKRLKQGVMPSVFKFPLHLQKVSIHNLLQCICLHIISARSTSSCSLEPSV
uniref:THAP-type domain-containing protein n=1 Tax=Eptatretus burgeri TaxID=7764 RepID=A0A8C4Q649_EPTBU